MVTLWLARTGHGAPRTFPRWGASWPPPPLGRMSRTRDAGQVFWRQPAARHPSILEVAMLLRLFFTVVGCTLLGFLAGLFAFKVKSRWCPRCGTTTSELAGQHRARP
ncbi:hypothetical protein [Plantactinospora mayteni]|nr:hypothetical protein [Plantactinospora mayteni]